METSAPVPLVIVDEQKKTIRPSSPDGDTYFGLGPGTNGTAAETRRALHEVPGYSWTRFAGSHPKGLLYVPPKGEPEFFNPWTMEKAK